jgi:serine/arginine repetitive matrix protein 2
MYQNVGLKTPRGSGTSGYVQKNVSFLKPKSNSTNINRDISEPTPEALPFRKPSDEVLLHNARRAIELDLLDYQDALLQAHPNISSEELAIKVDAQRQLRLQELQKGEETIRTEKEGEMERMRSAFGIGEGFREGQAFRFGDEEERKQIVQAKYEQQQRDLFYANRK